MYGDNGLSTRVRPELNTDTVSVAMAVMAPHTSPRVVKGAEEAIVGLWWPEDADTDQLPAQASVSDSPPPSTARSGRGADLRGTDGGSNAHSRLRRSLRTLLGKMRCYGGGLRESATSRLPPALTTRHRLTHRD